MKAFKNNFNGWQSVWISGALFLLYFSVPLIFSHVPLLFGINWTFEAFGNYEGLRKVWVLVLCVIALVASGVVGVMATKGAKLKSLFE